VDAPMTPNIAADFARHLSSKNYIISDLSLTSSRQSENSTELSLRKLWELTDLSANDFAD
jgi:general secretion pathway protein E